MDWKSSSMYTPFTSGFSSCKRETATCALGVLTVSAVRKKLFPTSSGLTRLLSTTVNPPIPGKTKFFSVSVPVADALIKHTWADSNDAWPWSPHSLSCLSYFVAFVEGTDMTSVDLVHVENGMRSRELEVPVHYVMHSSGHTPSIWNFLHNATRYAATPQPCVVDYSC